MVVPHNWKQTLLLAILLSNVSLHLMGVANANDSAKDWAGICYSAGGAHGPEDVDRDIATLSKRANILRTYSMWEGGRGADILESARRYNMRVYQGLWLGPYPNEGEMTILQERIEKRQLDGVEAIIVGSETQYRQDFPQDQLIGYIMRVREMLRMGGYGHIKVTTADTSNCLTPEIINAVDVVVSHKHPYWEGTPVVESANRILDYINTELIPRAQGKECIIGETGWPEAGATLGAAVASPDTQAFFYNDMRQKSKQPTWQSPYGHKIFYFEGFDSDYKYVAPGDNDVERHWGIYYPNRVMKPHIRAITHDPVQPFPAPASHEAMLGAPAPHPAAHTSIFAALGTGWFGHHHPHHSAQPLPPDAGVAPFCHRNPEANTLVVSNLSAPVRCVVYPNGAQKAATFGQPELFFSAVPGNDFVLLFDDDDCNGNLIAQIPCL